MSTEDRWPSPKTPEPAPEPAAEPARRRPGGCAPRPQLDADDTVLELCVPAGLAARIAGLAARIAGLAARIAGLAARIAGLAARADGLAAPCICAN
jgi:hypothetical protein